MIDLVNSLIKMFFVRFNSLSTNIYEEVENNQKWTENQFIKYRKDHLGHMNECLKVVQEKLVRCYYFLRLTALHGGCPSLDSNLSCVRECLYFNTSVGGQCLPLVQESPLQLWKSTFTSICSLCTKITWRNFLFQEEEEQQQQQQQQEQQQSNNISNSSNSSSNNSNNSNSSSNNNSNNKHRTTGQTWKTPWVHTWEGKPASELGGCAGCAPTNCKAGQVLMGTPMN